MGKSFPKQDLIRQPLPLQRIQQRLLRREQVICHDDRPCPEQAHLPQPTAAAQLLLQPPGI